MSFAGDCFNRLVGLLLFSEAVRSVEGGDSTFLVSGRPSCVTLCLKSPLVVYQVSLFSLIIVGVAVWVAVQLDSGECHLWVEPMGLGLSPRYQRDGSTV